MKKSKRTMIALISVAALGAAACLYTFHPKFGARPKGDRLTRIEASAHYDKEAGMFRNLENRPTRARNSGNPLAIWWKMMTNRDTTRQPQEPLEMAKEDLNTIPSDGNYMVWFGHSSYLLSLRGVTLLVDPVLCSGSPVSFFNKPFDGTMAYTPEDMPQRIDYLIITHDHYDHLDYECAKRLRERVQHVICPLGVGAHLERWGYEPSLIAEMDWDEQTNIGGSMRVTCLPAQHFSGRLFHRNNTLWASFMLSDTPLGNIFLSGDGGYGSHFAAIGERFGHVDLALLENGQYNDMWSNIHTMPDELAQIVNDLRAKRVITTHHSKFALAHHPWQEPKANEQRLAETTTAMVIAPLMGKITELH